MLTERFLIQITFDDKLPFADVCLLPLALVDVKNCIFPEILCLKIIDHASSIDAETMPAEEAVVARREENEGNDTGRADKGRRNQDQ